MTVSISHPHEPASLPAHAPRTGSPKRYPLAYASALIVAAGCLGLALPMVVAGISSIHAERALVHWEAEDSPPSQAFWALTLSRAERSVAWYPVANGEYLDRLGRVRAWGVSVSEAEQLDGQPQMMEGALEAFRRSTEARPAWPWTWLRLAYGKGALDRFDEEFELALHRASATGAGRLDVNRSLAQLGFSHWDQLTRTQRTLALQAARRAASHSPAEAGRVYAQATAAGLQQPFCWSLGKSIQSQQQICMEEGSDDRQTQ
jgi:hypothetical protein